MVVGLPEKADFLNNFLDQQSMKKILLLLGLLGPLAVSAQIAFAEIGDADFTGVSNAAMAFGDVDSDGFEDVVVCGSLPNNSASTVIYYGNGAGEFNPDYNTSGALEDLTNGANALLDVNGDGDLDFVATGTNSSGSKVARLFTGNGGSAWQFASNPFAGVSLGSIAYADIDGDNDLDIVISGQNQVNQRVTNLYTNDGSGTFSWVSTAGLEAVSNSDLAFADVDGDSDQDLMVTGFSASNQRIANLYLNDGNGVFALQTGSPFSGVVNSGIDFVDVDGDLDQDLVLTGQDASNQRIAELYTNNGSGTFSLVTGTTFEGVANSSVSHGDVDGDGDQDLVLMGINGANQVTSKVYTNNGSGAFSLSTTNVIDGAQNGAVQLRDFNGNNNADMMLFGLNSAGNPIGQIYLNDGNGRLTNANSQAIGVRRGKPDYADVDGDGDLDCMVIGQTAGNTGSTQLLLNNGMGAFEVDTLNNFPAFFAGSIAFGDIDGDNDQDVIISGNSIASTNGNGVTKLYTNNGSGVYTEVFGTNFPGLYDAYVDFGDVDGDSDLDLLMCGRDPYNNTALFLNNGSGVFVEDTINTIADCSRGRFVLEDLDFDSDLDLVIVGVEGNTLQAIAKLYTNDGNGAFTEVNSVPFVGAYYGDVAAGDLDGDNDIDLVISGNNPSGSVETNVYQNDGLGNFTTLANHGLFPLSRGGIELDDVDGDGDLDVAMVGNASTSTSVSRIGVIMENNGFANFSQVTGLWLSGAYRSDLVMFDIDGDADKDVFITGDGSGSSMITTFFRNTSIGCIPSVLNPTSLNNLSVCPGQTFTLQLDNSSNLNGSSNWVVYESNCSGPIIASSSNNTISFTPSSSQTSFSIRAEGGCLASPGQCYSFNVVQNALPQVSAGSDQSICLGDSVVLSATSNANISWAGGVQNGQAFAPGTTGVFTFTVTATDSNSCISMDSVNVTVDEVVASIQNGSNGMIASPSGATYQWIDCQTLMPVAGATNEVFLPAMSGDYSVAVTQGGCTDTSVCFNFQGVGIEEGLAGNLQAYPNPSQGWVKLRSEGFSLAGTDVQVMNGLGQVVLREENVANEAVTLDLSGMEKGIYLVRIQRDHALVGMAKLVLQ